MQLRQVNKNQNSFEFEGLTSFFEVTMRMHEVRGQRSVPGHVWPSEDMTNMHEARGWDSSLEVKTQLEVTHAQELNSDLMQTNRDLTG